MEINPSSPVGRTEGLPSSPGLRRTVSSFRRGDSIDISEIGEFLSKMRAMDGVRHDRVEEIRKQLAQGTIDTPEKLDAAFTKLLDDLDV